jgi:hypothetical protein
MSNPKKITSPENNPFHKPLNDINKKDISKLTGAFNKLFTLKGSHTDPLFNDILDDESIIKYSMKNTKAIATKMLVPEKVATYIPLASKLNIENITKITIYSHLYNVAFIINNAYAMLADRHYMSQLAVLNELDNRNSTISYILRALLGGVANVSVYMTAYVSTDPKASKEAVKSGAGSIDMTAVVDYLWETSKKLIDYGTQGADIITGNFNKNIADHIQLYEKQLYGAAENLQMYFLSLIGFFIVVFVLYFLYGSFKTYKKSNTRKGSKSPRGLLPFTSYITNKSSPVKLLLRDSLFGRKRAQRASRKKSLRFGKRAICTYPFCQEIPCLSIIWRESGAHDQVCKLHAKVFTDTFMKDLVNVVANNCGRLSFGRKRTLRISRKHISKKKSRFGSRATCNYFDCQGIPCLTFYDRLDESKEQQQACKKHAEIYMKLFDIVIVANKCNRLVRKNQTNLSKKLSFGKKRKTTMKNCSFPLCKSRPCMSFISKYTRVPGKLCLEHALQVQRGPYGRTIIIKSDNC